MKGLRGASQVGSAPVGCAFASHLFQRRPPPPLLLLLVRRPNRRTTTTTVSRLAGFWFRLAGSTLAASTDPVGRFSRLTRVQPAGSRLAGSRFSVETRSLPTSVIARLEAIATTPVHLPGIELSLAHHARKIARHHNESAVATSIRASPPDSARLRSRNAL